MLPVPPGEREGITDSGGWHKKAEDQVRRLARAQARSSGKEEDVAIQQLFQQLGVLLVNGNAAMLLIRKLLFEYQKDR